MRILPFFFVLAFSTTAAANNIGIFGKSGRDTDSGTCTQCHNVDGIDATVLNTPAPTITVDGLDGPFFAGGTADITITVKTNDPSGGIAEANCPVRCAGFGAAVDKGAGFFIVPDGSPVQVNGTRDEVAHIAKQQFVDGAVSYHVLLGGLAVGDHTLFVAGNDVDGQIQLGDRVASATFPFTVDESSPPPPQDGGCAQTGGDVPALGALFLLALLALRRRSAGATSAALVAGACLVLSGNAQAANPRNSQDNCPSAVPGATTAVKDVDGGVELTVTGSGHATNKIRKRARSIAAASKRQPKATKHNGRGDGGGRTGRCPVVMVKSSVVAKNVDGGALLTVKADNAADVDWLRKETRARLEEQTAASAGHGKMLHCPSALDGAATQVTDTKDGVVVTVTGPEKDIRARTKDLIEAASKADESAMGHGGNGQGGGSFGRCPVVVTDTKLSAADVPGGSKITVAAKAPAGVAALQKEAHARAERFPAPAAAAPEKPAPENAPATPAPHAK